MKFILSIILFLLCGSAFSQLYNPQAPTTYGERVNRIQVLGTIWYPTGCGDPTGLNSTDMHQSAMYFDSCNHRVWVYDPKPKTWDSLHLSTTAGLNVIHNGGDNYAGNIRIGGLHDPNGQIFFEINGSAVLQFNLDTALFYTFQHIIGESAFDRYIRLPLLSSDAFRQFGTIYYNTITGKIRFNSASGGWKNLLSEGDLSGYSQVGHTHLIDDVIGLSDSIIGGVRIWQHWDDPAWIDSLSYFKIKNKPFIPSNTNQLVNGSDFIDHIKLLQYLQDSITFTTLPIPIGGGLISTLTAAGLDSLHIVGFVQTPGNFYYYGTNSVGSWGTNSLGIVPYYKLDTTGLGTLIKSLFSGSAPISYVNGLVSIAQANGSVDGFLSHTDWTTFNNKLSSIDTTDIPTFSAKVRSLFSASSPINYSNGAISLTGRVDYAHFNQGSSLSVLGITGNATADHASITAGTDHFVLRRLGTALGFGLLDSTNVPDVHSENYYNTKYLGSTGTNNANVGSGFRILKPSTQELKTFFILPSTVAIIDSTTNANALTIIINKAAADVNGYLDQADFVTFSKSVRTVASGSVSNAATLDIDLTSINASFESIEIELYDVLPATNGAFLYMRVSTNAGSTYDASAGNYHWGFDFDDEGTGGDAGSASATEIAVSGNGSGVSSTASAGNHFTIKAWNLGSSTFKPSFKYFGAYQNSSNVQFSLSGSGYRNAAQDTDHIRFLFSTGNITAKYIVTAKPL